MRVTTIHRDKQIINKNEAEDHDEGLQFCGSAGLACAIVLIPEGYKKICELSASCRK